MIAARRVRPSATLRPATTPMAPPNSAASTIPTKITIRMSAQRREYFKSPTLNPMSATTSAATSAPVTNPRMTANTLRMEVHCLATRATGTTPFSGALRGCRGLRHAA